MPNLWTFEEKFNTLTDGGLDGQNSWVKIGANDLIVTTTGTPYPDPTSIKHVVNGASAVAYKDKNSSNGEVASGTVYFSHRRDGVSDSSGFYLGRSGYGVTIYIIFYANGVIKVYDGDTLTTITPTYTQNVYFRMGVAFECGAGGWEGLASNTFKVNFNNGAWSSAYAFNIDTAGVLDYVHLEVSLPAGEKAYFDYISPVYSPTIIGPFPTFLGTNI